MQGRRYLLFLGLVTVLLGLMWSPTTASADSTIVRVAKGQIQPEQFATPAGVKTAPTISAGTLSAASPADIPQIDEADVRADGTADPGGEKAGVTISSAGCGNRNTGRNVRVNQDCTFRRQAEELIKANPANPRNLIAGQNDAVAGFNHCGFDFSFDSGSHWGSGIPPFFQRLNAPPPGHTIAGGPGTGHTYDAASDPALAFDSRGRAFFSCVLFDVNSNAGAIAVTASVPGAGGSFYNNVPAAGSAFIVAEDNSPTVAPDKEFITADANPSSPNRDNVYVTWTNFKFGTTCGVVPDGRLRQCSSAIFGSMSTDHAVTWSRPEEISGSSPLCFFGNILDPSRSPNACDLDQGSDPVTLPNGDLAVVFHNGNTAPTNPNAQQLSVTCHPGGSSVDGTAHLNCASPAKVGDDLIVGRPRCNFGRGPEACIPGAFIRTNDFPRIAVNAATGTLYSAWQDFRTSELDIELSRSADGGKTWTQDAGTVNGDRGFDHYMPAIDAVAGRADRVGISYYRTPVVPNEGTQSVFAPGQPGVQAEPSQVFLSGGRSQRTPFAARSISPMFAPPQGNQAGFNGDYSGLAIVGETAHPVWSDTRNTAPAGQVATTPAPDEDVFTDRVEVPGQDD